MKNTLSQITLIMDKFFTKQILELLQTMGVPWVRQETGRSLVLKKRSGFHQLFSSQAAVSEDQVVQFQFLLRADQASEALYHLVKCLHLDIPGRGSVWFQTLDCLATPLDRPPELNLPKSEFRLPETNLTGICCITQMGEGQSAAEIGLTTGTAVPVITFGTGTGVRNRLGLWRIMIPAEKEITHLVVDSEDADTVMEMMISTNRLDQPGRGFIYSYPVVQGFLNTKFHDGHTSQAASIEQIVSAIDDIKGTTEWRRKVLNSPGTGRSRRFLSDLVNLQVVCNEGQGEILTQAAMAAGANGATINRTRHVFLSGESHKISPAREISVMTVGSQEASTLLKALEDAGLSSDEASGEVYIHPVPKACTYLGK